MELLGYRDQVMAEVTGAHAAARALPVRRSDERAGARSERLKPRNGDAGAGHRGDRPGDPELSRLAEVLTQLPGRRALGVGGSGRPHARNWARSTERQIGQPGRACAVRLRQRHVARGAPRSTAGGPRSGAPCSTSARVGLRQNPALKALYDRLTARGKPGKVALVAFCACARRW